MKKNQKIWIPIIVGLAIVIFIVSRRTTNSPSKSLDTVASIPISLPYSFKTEEAEQLSIKAFDLRNGGQLDDAIRLCQEAINIEHDNPMLFFDISECYARSNRLNDAILAIDTAITLDSLYAPFYNNRGLYSYKVYNDQGAINDYKKAIELDSMSYIYHANLSLYIILKKILGKLAPSLG